MGLIFFAETAIFVCKICGSVGRFPCELIGWNRRDSLALEARWRGDSMLPRERRSTGQNDLFRSRLDQIVDMKHPLAKLGGHVDWAFLEKTFGAAYEDGPGQPPLPTRLRTNASHSP
jgi:hypothetical protein